MLNQYQRGSLFGAIIVTVAFSAAFSTIKYPHRNPSDYPAVNINSDSQRGESFWEKASRDPVAVFTGALVIVGSAQAALFLWQLDLMRKGLRDAKNSADAAKDTAEATGEAVAISRESAVRELRAYVLISEPRLDLNPETDWFDAHVSFRNYGRTPAYFSQVKIEQSIRATIDPLEVLVLSPAAMTNAETIIPPDTFHVARIPGIVAKSNFNNAFGMIKLYVWGIITYTDAFGDHRSTQFQLVHHMTNINQFSYCEAGNKTDDKLASLSIHPPGIARANKL